MKKARILFGVVICLILIISAIAITATLDSRLSEIGSEIEDSSNKAEWMYMGVSNDKMIGRGNGTFNVTPKSADISDGYLNVSGILNNSTKNSYTVRDYCIVHYGGYKYPADIIFENENATLEGKGDLPITIKFNIENLRYVNIIPTEISVELGTYDSKNNYKEFDFSYIISWI